MSAKSLYASHSFPHPGASQEVSGGDGSAQCLGQFRAFVVIEQPLDRPGIVLPQQPFDGTLGQFAEGGRAEPEGIRKELRSLSTVRPRKGDL